MLHSKTICRKADIIIGALDETQLTKKYFVASRSYYHDALVLCVQQNQPIPIWQNILYLCHDPFIYILFVINDVIFIFIGYFLEQFEQTKHKSDWNTMFLVMCCAYFNSSTNYRPKFLPSKVFFAFGLLSGMLFSICIPTRLLQIIGNPIYNDPIQSTDLIIKNSFKLFGDSFGFQHLKRQKYVNMKLLNVR